MEITSEMRQKVVKATSAEEIKELAAANGISLSDEEAKKLFVFGRDGELSDEDLEIVAGGKGTPSPRYQVGQHLWLGYFTSQSYLEVEILEVEFYVKGDGWRYLVLGVDRDWPTNEYLETRQYVHTSDPGPGWHN